MTTSSTEIDPFGGSEKTPSLSFKDKAPGTVVEGVVTQTPELIQGRDFETGEPAAWKDGNPKMVAVLRILVDDEELSVWAPKPSALFAAIAAAQRATKRIELGGSIAIKYTGDKPNDNPRLNAARQYAVRYTPPVARDPFTEVIPATAFTSVTATTPPANGWDQTPPF